jgi:hypothetical protein
MITVEPCRGPWLSRAVRIIKRWEHLVDMGQQIQRFTTELKAEKHAKKMFGEMGYRVQAEPRVV